MTSLQRKLDSVPQGETLSLWPAKGEYQGPVVMNHSLTLDGQDATIWARTGPVLSIKSNQVILKNLRIEVTEFEGISSEQNRCAILVEFRQGVQFHNVEVRGKVIGLPEEEGEWKYPNQLNLENLAPDTEYDLRLRIVVPVACKIESNISGIAFTPNNLTLGSNEIQIHVQPLPKFTSINNAIFLVSPFLKRRISITVNIPSRPHQQISLSQNSIIWEAEGWSTSPIENQKKIPGNLILAVSQKFASYTFKPNLLALTILLGVVGIMGILFFLFARKSDDNFASVPNVPSGLFNYGGSTTWAPIRNNVDSEIQKVLPKFQLRYTHPIKDAPGSGTGIKMLLDDQLAFSQSSRPINDQEYQKAQQHGFKLKEIPVAIDGIVIAVHPNLNVRSLTLAQIKDIYTSKITNWEQVGGPNLPITPYSRPLEAGGTIEFFHENVLAKKEFGKNVQFISTTTEALRQVGTNAGGIYYASAPEVVGQCTVKPLPLAGSGKLIPPYKEPFIPLQECPQKRNQINAADFQNGAYPITRRLFVIVKQNGQRDQQAGEAYANLVLTTQGQELIMKTGFVKIR